MSPTFLEHERVPSAPIDDPTNADDIPHYLRKDDLTASSTIIAEVRYVCGLDGCNKDYSQRQGALRHRREAHDTPHPCFDSRCEFKWTRPYEYATHVEKRHPGFDPDKVLGKRARSPSRSTITGRDRPPHLFRAPSERPSQAEPKQRSTPPLPAEPKVTHVPLPAMSPMACDPQPENPEPAIRHKDTFGLESLGATDPSSAFSEAYAEIEELRTGDPNRVAGSTADDHPTNTSFINPIFERSVMYAYPSLAGDHGIRGNQI